MSLGSEYRLLAADVYELAGASRRAGERIASSVGLSVTRWHVLSVVSEVPATVPTIADRLGLRRQSVQPVSDDLVRDGHALWQDNSAHRRSPLLTITAEGTTSLRRVVDAADDQRDRQLLAAGLSAERIAAAREVLRAVLAALDDPRRPRPREEAPVGLGGRGRGTA